MAGSSTTTIVLNTIFTGSDVGVADGLAGGLVESYSLWDEVANGKDLYADSDVLESPRYVSG